MTPPVEACHPSGVGANAMDPKHLFADHRSTGTCAYCGGKPHTRDHVPSRVLLDDPLPPNVPVVNACEQCNQGFSRDEEYLACFLECVLCGTTDPRLLRRAKIQRIMTVKPEIAAMIAECRRPTDDSGITWIPDEKRVRNVVLKLARGHAAFELGLPQVEPPIRTSTVPLCTMSGVAREEFERAGSGEIRGWPELCSRTFLRAAGASPYEDQSGPWVSVQEGRYRYSVEQHRGVRVRIVVDEYLASDVEWE
jgi:hypothetical protein